MKLLKNITIVCCLVAAQALYGAVDAMFDAIRKGDSAWVEEFLAQGYTVDEKSEKGWTALMLAAAHDEKDIVKILLEHGAKVDEKNEDRQTALMLAAVYDAKDIVKILLERGAKVDAKDKDRQTALVWAARSGNEKTVNILILFANKEDLKVLLANNMTYRKELSKDIQDFIEWILKGSPRKDLEKNAVRFFVARAFAMPHFVPEFEMLFKVLGKDYAQLFTADVIERALLTQNIKAFEILIDKARKDNNSNLLKLITVEVEKFPKTNFNQKFFAQLKDLLGAKISGMEKAKNVYFGFE